MLFIFQIQKIVNLDAITEDNMQELDTLIKHYMTAISLHAPKLQRKVKTHLLTHMVLVVLQTNTYNDSMSG